MANVIITPALTQSYNVATFVKPVVTTAGSSGAWNVGTINIFTITGLVELTLFGVVTTAITSTAGTGTLALGSTGNGAIFTAAATVNGSTNFLINSVWPNTAPDNVAEQLSSTAPRWVMQNGGVATVVIGTNNMTAGGMTIYCKWFSYTGGTVVAATP